MSPGAGRPGSARLPGGMSRRAPAEAMQLVLAVLRCPETVAPETRTVVGGEFTVGRGPGVDWVLPDPERLLSKRHFAVAFRGGAWQIADISTNGTYINRDPAPIGRDRIRTIRDGDRLRLGAYEIELRLIEQPATSYRAGARGGSTAGRFAGFPLDDPLAPPGVPRGAPIGAPGGAELPEDFDPLASSREAPFPGLIQRDDGPVLQDAFTPPPAQLPDDWDKDLSGIALPRERAAVSRPATQAGPSRIREARPQPPPGTPSAAAGDEPLPASLLQPPRPHADAPPREPAAQAPSRPDPQDLTPLAAFLRGAGLPDAEPADPVATMEALGAAFRSLVGGLRAVLIARATIKSEFRIEQTAIRARGNNPLKFSANDDDALAALLGAGRRADMGPSEAIADALRDLRLHELASMSAMQAAVRALLDGLNPSKLRAQVEQGGGLSLLPAQRKARAWDAYEALHARTAGALSDDFDSVFGKAFARAYERALAEIAGKEPR